MGDKSATLEVQLLEKHLPSEQELVVSTATLTSFTCTLKQEATLSNEHPSEEAWCIDTASLQHTFFIVPTTQLKFGFARLLGALSLSFQN